MKIELDLIPLNEVDNKIIDALKDELKEKNFIVRIFAKMNLPKTALNFYRKQYNAEIIIDVLRTMEGYIIGLTEKDLYVRGSNFVFSVAEYDCPCVISIFRLNPIFYKESQDFNLLINRLVKEVLYCIGKIKGLKDCTNPKCIMYRAKSVRDIDFKEKNFCNDCKINNILEGIEL
ncbi:MAG TPA: hypothetical protein EYP80_00110 [Candidatus Aenigmarchaeota archaeon]|nr:hypothetical protein [Candidatus Aenigmarchaeota archaeon]